ncbi:uncharacterized protein G2W53_004998 [Senna tora]|uniref:Uncharacterized protein n=1 Tax=Senna tora TaxID=362788 RepID=A0A835CJU8_9FABA|nr:uncharacterized protein G2W53_004998 [Senna tora]
MNTAKKEFYKKNTTPKWISEVHWKEMMQVTSAWIEAPGGITKGILYGLGSNNTTFVCGRDHTSMSTSTSTPTTHNFDSSDFQEAVNRVVEEKLSEMRTRLQEEMQTTIQATIEAMRSSQPPI